MSDDVFWSIIERTLPAADDPDAQIEALRAELGTLKAEDVAAFEAALSAQLDRSYAWSLWGAVYVAHGGASDDGFEYFRLWLVSKGRAVFETVLADPDSLADLDLAPGPDGVFEFEGFVYVAMDVWAQKTGRPIEDMPRSWSGLHPGGPDGERFDETPQALARRYPKLWRKFGENPLGY